MNVSVFNLATKKYILVACIFIVVILLFLGVIILLNKPKDKKDITTSTSDKELSSQQIQLVQKESIPLIKKVNSTSSKEKVISVKKIIDHDGDGVDDQVELELGTSPDNIDSDYDGIPDGEEIYGWKTNPLTKDTDKDKLFDYWEVKRYFTDPLNPDTDGDGYLDGEEVLNGYNPKGPGKLQQ